MYNPTIKEIKPLQCFNCGSQSTIHKPYDKLGFAKIYCLDCPGEYALQIPVYNQLRKQWLLNKLYQIQILEQLCKN